MDLSKELKVGVVLMVLFWIIVGGLMLKKSQSATQTNTSVVPISTTFTLDEVAKHNKETDCWLTISNNVYGVTNYLSVHPGGMSEIIPYCGTDATIAFTGMVKHRGRAMTDLATLLIGSLR